MPTAQTAPSLVFRELYRYMITRKTPLLSYFIASAVVGAMTLLLWWLRDNLTAANISLLYLLGTFGVAVWLGTGPSLLAALMTFFGFNFFLIKPYYTLAVEDSHELIDLFVYLLVAMVAGQLAIDSPWKQMLHQNSVLIFNMALSGLERVVVTIVPYQIKREMLPEGAVDRNRFTRQDLRREGGD